MPKKSNYRKKYKQYYNIDFNMSYHIHHLDMDRENNDIANLLLLPAKVHNKYHMALNMCNANEFGVCEIDTKTDITSYEMCGLKNLVEALEEMEHWKQLKLCEYSFPSRIFERYFDK